MCSEVQVPSSSDKTEKGKHGSILTPHHKTVLKMVSYIVSCHWITDFVFVFAKEKGPCK